jgi:hypothetical protein
VRSEVIDPPPLDWPMLPAFIAFCPEPLCCWRWETPEARFVYRAQPVYEQHWRAEHSQGSLPADA